MTPDAGCVEYLVDLARVDVGFLSGLKNRCFVIEHFPDSSRYSIFELSRRQTPAAARWRRFLDLEVARDVVAVPSFSFSRVTWRKPIAILVDQSPDEGTLFDPGVAAPASHRTLTELLLRSIPHCAVQDRLVLTGMADVFVTDFTDVNRIREQRVKCP